MIFDIRGNDYFCTIVLILIEKHMSKVHGVNFAGTKQICLNMMYWSGRLCSSTVFELKWYFD